MPADLFTLFRYLFIFLRGVALRAAFMGHRSGALVAFTAFVAFMEVGVGRLWLSQHF